MSDREMGAFVAVPAGRVLKGSGALYPEEVPEMTLHVEGFEIQIHEVTNRQFADFVNETGYVTDAERSVAEGRPGAGSAVFTAPEGSTEARDPWDLVDSANWHAPTGTGSLTTGLDGHPVVHISRRDAAAYALWAGGRLPTEVEWEYAASLGLPDPDRTTSSAYDPAGAPIANTWQGVFPIVNSARDGFAATAPVGCYPASEIGLYDMIGNVWEWTSTPYSDTQYTIKGGSYLCSDNFCRRYRPAARQPQDEDFSTSHIGFRIVRDRAVSDEPEVGR